MDSSLPNPYAAPVAPAASPLPLDRVGIRFGLVFCLPLYVLLAVTASELLTRGNFRDLPAIAALVVLCVAVCGCGWWWAVKARGGFGWFLVTGAVQGVALTVLALMCLLGFLSVGGGFNFSYLSGIWDFFFITPFLTAWLMVRGALVRWRVRVLQRRRARAAG